LPEGRRSSNNVSFRDQEGGRFAKFIDLDRVVEAVGVIERYWALCDVH
jgi:hypothetical protein